MSVIINKGQMWDLLDDKAFAFASWLNSGSAEATGMKTMLENTEGIDLVSPLISSQLIPLLLSLGVIDQAVKNRIDARVAQGSIDEAGESIIRRFKIVPANILSEEAMRAWVLPYCTGESPYISYDKDMNIIVELAGECTAPGAQEVI